MRLFLATSALLKRYVRERGSEAVDGVLLSADRRQLTAAAAEGLATLDAAGGGHG